MASIADYVTKQLRTEKAGAVEGFEVDLRDGGPVRELNVAAYQKIAGKGDGRSVDELRADVEAAVDENQADPTGGRSEADEQARETAANASTGEAHEQSEEAR